MKIEGIYQQKVAEEELKQQQRRDKKVRHAAKSKIENVEERRVFILKMTKSVKRIQEANDVLNLLLEVGDSNVGTTDVLKDLFKFGVLDALYGCMKCFPKHPWFSLKGIKVMNHLFRHLWDLYFASKYCLRLGFVQLAEINACDYIAELMDLYGKQLMDYAETCMEAMVNLVCSPVSIRNVQCTFLTGLVNPNIAIVCNHPLIESLVVELFNHYEDESTAAFARHTVQLIVVFITHDNNDKYRPDACDVVAKALQRHSDSEVVALCKSALALLRTNDQNKEKLELLNLLV